MHCIQIQTVYRSTEFLGILFVAPKNEHEIFILAGSVSVSGWWHAASRLRSRPAMPSGIKAEQRITRRSIVTATPYVDFVTIHYSCMTIPRNEKYQKLYKKTLTD